MEQDHNPEVPEHLLAASKMVESYATGQISPEQFSKILDAWWETHKEAWQENDLHRLFLLVCLSN
jgi:hypothetical protein